MSTRIDPTAYVLGLLPADEAARAAELERTDRGFAAEVHALRAVSARLDVLGTDEWTPEPPPPLVVPGGRPAPLAAAPVPPWRRLTLPSLRLSPALAGGLAAVLLAVGVGAGALLGGGDGSPATPSTPAGGGQPVALAQFGSAPAGAGARALVSDRAGHRVVRLAVHGLPANDHGSFYEVWMIRDATHMVSLGTFRVGPDGRSRVTLPVSVDPTEYPIMDVSLEPDDGDPAHSHNSLLRSSPKRV
jgi:anti-sigma-K factor RskA